MANTSTIFTFLTIRTAASNLPADPGCPSTERRPMHDLARNEDRLRGTYDFPFEFHHIASDHPRYVMSYHWHVEYEIIRILEGTLLVTLDEKTFSASSGDVIFVHGGVLHAGIPNDCVYECIVFDLNAFLKSNPACTELMQKISRQELFPYAHFTAAEAPICQAVGPLFEAMRDHKEGYELSVFGQFYHFFGLVFSNHYFTEEHSHARRDLKRVMQLKKVVEFLEKNYTTQITLAQMSEAVSMSPKYFCRFFSEMTHQTPMDYLNRMRIEQACYELSASDDSITEIAYRNGFNDLSYFIRTFRKYKGTTPGKYKRR